MKNWVLIAIIFIVVGLIGAGVTLGKDGFTFQTERILQEESVPAAGIKQIHLDTKSTDVQIVPTEGDEIKVQLKGKASKKFIDRIKLGVETKGDVLTIIPQADTGFSIGINILSVDLMLELPKQQYEALIVEGSSGSVDIQNWEGSRLDLDISSGNVTLGQIKGNTKVAASSGDVTLQQVEGEQLTLEASSGNITLEQVRVNKGTITAGSGEVELLDAEGSLSVKTGSGNIEFAAKQLIYPLDFKTGSGEVTLATEETPANATISFDTGSGEMTTEWEQGYIKEGRQGGEIKFGSGAIPVTVDTSSGNLFVEKR